MADIWVAGAGLLPIAMGRGNPTRHPLPGWQDYYGAGRADRGPGVFQLGPVSLVYAANLTPDTATGIGGFTDRQIFKRASLRSGPGRHSPECG